MPSMNKAIILGHVGQDPKIRQTQNGGIVATFSVATSERWKDKITGDNKEQTEWHNVVCYKGIASVVERYVTKGTLVMVEGRLQTMKWQGKDGQDRYTTEIVANAMQMCGGRTTESGAPKSRPQSSPQEYGDATTVAHEAAADADDDQLPF